MKKIGLFLLLGFSLSWLVSACQERQQGRRKDCFSLFRCFVFGFYCTE